MNVPIGYPILAGGVEWLVGSSQPNKGVEVSTGAPNSTDHDMTAFLSPEQAELLALRLLVAARQVRTERVQTAENVRWRDLARLEAGSGHGGDAA